MPSCPDPRRRSRLQLGASALLALALLAGAVVWAWRPRELPPLPQAQQQPEQAAAGARGPGADAALWRVELWRPLRDPPPPQVQAAPPPPISAQLLAIAERQGQPVAVLEVESGGKLHYVPAGGRAGRYTVLRIEDGAVVIADGSREARLELPR